MTRLHLFEGFGIEIEYAIVDARTLDVRPIADRLLAAVAGREVSELERGEIAWSNELALHVLELKTNGPAPGLEILVGPFREAVTAANDALEPLGARLLPGAVHPWMDPERESRLWPHEYTEVYRAFDRIFGCSGHGWTNLQSIHVNLPFAEDEEFRRLHAAIRLVLPLLPALAAGSPVVDGRISGFLDRRLVAYTENAARIRSVAGSVVPEPATSRGEYERTILRPIYDDLEPHDPEGILRHEWVNARGAIARFGRGSIEIRLLDSQECVTADLAVAAATIDAVRTLVRGVDPDEANRVPTELLASVLRAGIRSAERAVIPKGAYASALGVAGGTSAAETWRALLDRGGGLAASPRFADHLRRIAALGPLGRRLLAALGPEPSRERLGAVYGRMAECLTRDEAFEGDV